MDNNLRKKVPILVNGDSYPCNFPFVKRDVSPLEKLVFARNQFGWPSNDIAFKEQTTNVEVRQALERRQQPLPSVGGVDDDDVALDIVAQNGEDLESYAERLNGYVQNSKSLENET